MDEEYLYEKAITRKKYLEDMRLVVYSLMDVLDQLDSIPPNLLEHQSFEHARRVARVCGRTIEKMDKKAGTDV